MRTYKDKTDCEDCVFFACLLLPPPMMLAGRLFWMRLDLMMLGEAPGSWPGLMGLAGFGRRQMTWVIYREQVDRAHPSYHTYSSHFFIKIQRNSLGIKKISLLTSF